MYPEGMVKVTRAFMADFDYLTERYGWTAADVEKIKQATRADPDGMCRYWSTLAKAHRAGYGQNAANGYLRLDAWCAQQGWPSPGEPLRGEA